MLMVRKIVLSLAAVLSVVGMAMAQNKQVSGTVTDTKGAPVIGATVVVDGTTIGTSTDAQGQYTLEAPADGVLAVSSIGYDEQKIAINGKTLVNVVLAEAAHALDDVIVTAYGEAKREAFSGSAVMVKTEEIVKSQHTNAIDALNGKVPGLQIVNATGQPGSASPTVIIRGISSIEAGKEPLIIVDGMSFAGSMNDINPADIESMSVLKDAAAAALYGSRGANGVILITTKRAKGRDAIVSVDIKVGVNQRAQQDYDFITDPGEYYEMHYKMLNNYYTPVSKMSPHDAHVKANATMIDPKAANGSLGYNVYTVPEGQTLIGRNGKLNPAATLGRVINHNGEDYLVTPDNWIDEVYMQGIRQEYNVMLLLVTSVQASMVHSVTSTMRVSLMLQAMSVILLVCVLTIRLRSGSRLVVTHLTHTLRVRHLLRMVHQALQLTSLLILHRLHLSIHSILVMVRVISVVTSMVTLSMTTVLQLRQVATLV